MPSLRLRVAIAWLVILILAAPLPAQVFPKAAPEQVGFSPQRLKQLTEVFQAYVADGKLAGSVVLVARRGKIAYLHAFGQRDREANAPMPADAIFRIASQTKAL
jgi:CubicO group peptidase (beta-lactamase class C family)